jgi:cyclophilin family peptidyl-prolyl cis-trans isomerase
MKLRLHKVPSIPKIAMLAEANLTSRRSMHSTKSLALYPSTHWIALFAICLCGIAGCGEAMPATSAEAVGDSATTDKARSATKSASRAERRHPVVVIDTSEGAIRVRLDGEKAPGTVRNFLNYANESFYDNTLVHFVDAGKIIVAGGYAADRTLKPARQTIRNEAHNGLKNVRGTIAMARDASRIDSASSQFFINLVDAPQRDYRGDSAADYGYCVFGEVTEGLDIAERISQAKTTNLGGDLVQLPDPAVVIRSIRVVE